MRALSLWQPWLEGGIFRFDKRGTQDNFEDAVEFILDAVKPAPGADRIAALAGVAEMRIGGRGRHHASGWWAPHPDLVRGAIVGRCRIDGVIHSRADLASYMANVPEAANQERWWMGGFALVLAGVERIASPIAYKGAQGIFDVPGDVLADAQWIPTNT